MSSSGYKTIDVGPALDLDTNGLTDEYDPFDAYDAAIDSNRRWAAHVNRCDPTFFFRSAQNDQHPPILWLGCSDSRVPETTLLGLKPGDVFTHRSIANIVNSTDIDMLSVVEYAVASIKVKHVVLCGHTSCGGIVAALRDRPTGFGSLDIWLQPVRALRDKFADELAALPEDKRVNFLVKKNVEAGLETLKRIPEVVSAINKRGLEVHGVIYDLGTGLVEELYHDGPEEVKLGQINDWRSTLME
jgi:carbonic anhydrase